MSKQSQESALRMLSALEAREWLVGYNYYRSGPVSLMLVGIRDLKQINDRHGREAGDAAIQQTAQRIARFMEQTALETGWLARMPGREFLLIAKGDVSQNRLGDAAAELIDILTQTSGGDIPISARIGLARSKAGEGGSELLHRAEEALGVAYSRKGERVSMAKPSSGGGRRQMQTLDTSLRDAIAQRQISVMLQPQFEVSTGRLVGAEALARWHHETLGEIGADQLFASADRCDLREELSQLLQAEAIRAAARWPAGLDDLKLSVNLGADELNADYVEALLALLKETQLPLERLTLELTEESLVRDLDSAAKQLEELRALGISIALDDFGTGYSSLAYLKTLPLDFLKLDKGMTPDITGDGKERIVLRAIIAMAQALGLKIIAEGIESEEELEMLRAEGCDYAQGFLMSVPLSPQDFEDFALRSN